MVYTNGNITNLEWLQMVKHKEISLNIDTGRIKQTTYVWRRMPKIMANQKKKKKGK